MANAQWGLKLVSHQEVGVGRRGGAQRRERSEAVAAVGFRFAYGSLRVPGLRTQIDLT